MKFILESWKIKIHEIYITYPHAQTGYHMSEVFYHTCIHALLQLSPEFKGYLYNLSGALGLWSNRQEWNLTTT